MIFQLIKSNKYLFSQFIYHNFNNSLFSSNFPSNLKAADILPTHRKKDKSDIEKYRPISIDPTLSKIYDVCMTKCINTLTKFFLNINAVFAKVIMHSIVYW